MEVGNLIIIVIVAVAVFVVVARSIVAMIYTNAPVAESEFFAVYRNNSYNPKKHKSSPIYTFEYRCTLSKKGVKRFGDLNILGFGDTPEEAYMEAKQQFLEIFQKESV
jgi:hypothetical protein